MTSCSRTRVTELLRHLKTRIIRTDFKGPGSDSVAMSTHIEFNKNVVLIIYLMLTRVNQVCTVHQAYYQLIILIAYELNSIIQEHPVCPADCFLSLLIHSGESWCDSTRTVRGSVLLPMPSCVMCFC